MYRPTTSWLRRAWIRAAGGAAALAVLALLGYFASAGFAGPLGPFADTTSTSTDSTSTASTTSSTSSTSSSTSTGTTTSTSTPTTTATTTTTTTPSGPDGQIRLANGKTSIPITSVSLPARLIIDSVKFSPGLVTSRRAPISVRVHISDSRGYWVRGALVFLRATPLVTSTPDEQITNQSGYVTLTVFPRATFPLKRGYHVQFFVRTRKEGDSLLAGVSSRRLAQVATSR